MTTTRRLALRLVTLLAATIACAAALLLVILRDLAVELTDEVRASRSEHRTTNRIPGGSMLKNTKVREFDSTTLLRAMNAELAARHGDTSRVATTLSDARQLAAEVAQPARRVS